MARLTNCKSREDISLLPLHIFGRDKNVASTHVNMPEISKIHAVIYWEDESWQLKDYSKNGVWLDGEKVEKNKMVKLLPGQKIMLSKLSTCTWHITDLSPPEDGSYHRPEPSKPGVLSNTRIINRAQLEDS